MIYIFFSYQRPENRATYWILNQVLNHFIHGPQLQVWKQKRTEPGRLVIDLLRSHTINLDHNILAYLCQRWNLCSYMLTGQFGWTDHLRDGSEQRQMALTRVVWITRRTCKSPGIGLYNGWIVTALSRYSIPNWHAQDYFHFVFLLLLK
jgi:hypothetical protein